MSNFEYQIDASNSFLNNTNSGRVVHEVHDLTDATNEESTDFIQNSFTDFNSTYSPHKNMTDKNSGSNQNQVFINRRNRYPSRSLDKNESFDDHDYKVDILNGISDADDFEFNNDFNDHYKRKTIKGKKNENMKRKNDHTTKMSPSVGDRIVRWVQKYFEHNNKVNKILPLAKVQSSKSMQNYTTKKTNITSCNGNSIVSNGYVDKRNIIDISSENGDGDVYDENSTRNELNTDDCKHDINSLVSYRNNQDLSSDYYVGNDDPNTHLVEKQPCLPLYFQHQGHSRSIIG